MSKRGEELTLCAMKEKLVKLSKIADKAKQETDEYMGVASEMLSINQELAEIIKSKEHSKAVIDKLEALQRRSAKADKIRKKDLLQLINKHSQAEIEHMALAHEIGNLEFRLSRRA